MNINLINDTVTGNLSVFRWLFSSTKDTIVTTAPHEEALAQERPGENQGDMTRAPLGPHGMKRLAMARLWPIGMKKRIMRIKKAFKPMGQALDKRVWRYD